VIVCVDVDYQDASATVALVGFTAWPDELATLEIVSRSSTPPAAYEPGRFFERELPYVLGILARVTEPLDAVIVDSYAWLGPDRPGLGARLHESVHAPVIGVAKSSFRGAASIEVTRGASANPLYVTAAGIDAETVADRIRAMHGPFRIPTLLKRCDALCRGNP
jgi:deoxyribonuclease V